MLIKHPRMRNEVIRTLKVLADSEYQKNAWIKHEYPEGIKYDDFDQAVHILFDDTKLAEDAESEIGYTIKDQAEAEAITKVVKAIDNLLTRMGTERADLEYISDPEWQTVIQSAQKALDVVLAI